KEQTKACNLGVQTGARALEIYTFLGHLTRPHTSLGPVGVVGEGFRVRIGAEANPSDTQRTKPYGEIGLGLGPRISPGRNQIVGSSAEFWSSGFWWVEKEERLGFLDSFLHLSYTHFDDPT